MSNKLYKKIKESPNGLTFLPASKTIEGTVAVTCQDQSRYSHFTGAIVRCMQQLPNVKFHMRIGNQLTQARNEVVAAMEGEWIWWMDDDHSFTPETLVNLLNHNVDIVGPLYVMRQMPPQTTARVRRINSETGKFEYGIPDIWDLKPGLYEVDSLGMAGMLVRKNVIEKMTKPYFKVGHINPEQIAEDIYFCDRAKELGFKIYLDTQNVLGHIAPTMMIPQFINNKWVTRLNFPNGSVDIMCSKGELL